MILPKKGKRKSNQIKKNHIIKQDNSKQKQKTKKQKKNPFIKKINKFSFQKEIVVY